MLHRQLRQQPCRTDIAGPEQFLIQLHAVRELCGAVKDGVEWVIAEHAFHQLAVAQIALDSGQIRQRSIFIAHQVNVDHAVALAE